MTKGRTAQIVALVFSAAFFAVLCALKSSAVSVWIADNVSRGLVEFVGGIVGGLPFSLYEALVYLLGITVVYFIVTLIVRLKRRRYARALSLTLSLLVCVAVFLNVYTLSAGFNYNKSRVALPLYEGEITKEMVTELAGDFAEDYGGLITSLPRGEEGTVADPYTTAQLGKLLSRQFDALDITGLSDYEPKVKTIASARIMSETHVTGVFFAPFGEVSINPWQANMDLPVTMAHEMAHAKGVMREDEANLVAYYVTCTSPDPYIRYSGYSAVYTRIFAAVHFDDELRGALYASLPAQLAGEIAFINAFWKKYDALDRVTDFFNDIYLKLQGVKEGTGSYIDRDVTVEVPGVDEDGNETVEVVYVYTDVQRLMFNILLKRKT